MILVLIGTLAALILWHQFCRKGSLYEDEQKEENAFDFSKSKVSAKNPSYTNNTLERTEAENENVLDEKANDVKTD